MKYSRLFILLIIPPLILPFTSLLSTGAAGRPSHQAAGPVERREGKYLVTLRLPEGGLYAGEEQEIEFRLQDLGRTDPVLGPPGVIRAVIRATISMPSMPSMPRAEEVAHEEGVPGDYGIHPVFAHGGEYLLTLEIKPPAGDQFSVSFPLLVKDAGSERKSRARVYRLESKTEPKRVRAGEPARLRLKVWADRERRDAKGRPIGKRDPVEVREFDLMHERLLHLIVVSSDLEFFAHLHPEQEADGSFVLDGLVLPASGVYRLFADAAPKGAGAQIMDASLKVEGKTEAKAGRAFEQKTVSEVDGIRVALAGAESLAPRRTLALRVDLREVATGEPIGDLEPYLGALGHLMMIDERAETLVHAHPDERNAQGGRGELSFLLRPPKAGRYRLWVEFKRAGRVRVAQFAIEVREADAQ